jgi:hypothetical protein
MWKLYQLAVIVGVGCLLIYWRENDPAAREPLSNGYLLGGIAIGAAYAATVVPAKLLDWYHGAKQRLSERIPRSRA